MAEVVMTGANEAPPRVSEWKRFRRVFFGRKVVLFGTIIIAFMVVIAIIGPYIAPYDPYAINLRAQLQGPSAEHWLGTDAVGRDTLSRLMYGSRTSLEIGLISVFFASLIGITLGSIAGYYGGWVYTVIMRFIDALMAFPMILLALVVAALLGGGERNVIIALSVSLMPQYARLMAGQVLTVKQNDYVLAVKSLGASDLRIMAYHIFLNCFAPLVVQMTLRLGSAILSEASLSFLGIGIQAPAAAWGSMVESGRNYLLKAPILSLAPGLAIMLVVFSFNMVGDGLRDALDPRLRGRL
jgi:ABC-type dipeptide/oligopeptide/nickel transport system permease subunit